MGGGIDIVDCISNGGRRSVRKRDEVEREEECITECHGRISVSEERAWTGTPCRRGRGVVERKCGEIESMSNYTVEMCVVEEGSKARENDARETEFREGVGKGVVEREKEEVTEERRRERRKREGWGRNLVITKEREEKEKEIFLFRWSE